MKTHKLHSTYLAQMDEIPPPLCRLIARTKSYAPRLLTVPEIAAASGLSWQKVAWIAKQKTFAKVRVEDADKFRAGCGITFANEREHRKYIMKNIRRDSAWECTFRRTWPNRAQWERKDYFKRVLKHL